MGTKNNMQALKKYMPPKYRTTLAEKFNVCEKYIDFIFRGERRRADIVDEAIKMAKEYQIHLRSQKKKLKAIIESK
jgi:hypothetical protein